MNAAVSPLAHLVLDTLLRGAILFGGARILLALLSDGPALLRHRVVVASFALAFLLPVAGAFLPPRFALRALPAAESHALPDRGLLGTLGAGEPAFTGDAASAFVRDAEPTPARRSLLAAAPPPRRDAVPPAPLRAEEAVGFPVLVLAAWALGFLGIALRHGSAMLRLSRRLGRASAPSVPLAAAMKDAARLAGLPRPPRLLVLEELGGPATLGVLRPTVLVPSELAATLGPELLQPLLLHEALHVARRDVLLARAALLARALFWPVPFAWQLAAALVRDREILVDAAVVARSRRRGDYAEGLIEVIQCSGKGRTRLVPALGMASGSPHVMKQRLDLILGEKPSAWSKPGLVATTKALAVFGIVAAASLVVGLTEAVAQDPPATPASLATGGTVAKAELGPAIRAGLDYLARRQASSGAIDAEHKLSIGLTALAVLPMLGAGRSADPTADEPASRALRWLVKQQKSSGYLGSETDPRGNYEHALALLALSEAASLSGAGLYKEAAERAVTFALEARNPYRGWRYGIRPGDNDACITSWMLIALKAAKLAGLTVPPNVATEAIGLLDDLTDPATGRTGYVQRGQGPVRDEGLAVKFPASESESDTAQALTVRAYYGQTAGSNPLVAKGLTLLAAKPPLWSVERGSIDMHYWYFGTLATFQAGDAAFATWRPRLEAAVLPNQVTKGDDAGSWDPIDPWGKDGGRIYSTALMTLCLEVLDRYGRVVTPGAK